MDRQEYRITATSISTSEMSEHLITNLIRQYCDGELNEEQIAQVEQHLQDHPEDRAIVESEHKLRKRIEAVVKADCPHAPAGLTDQIKAEFAKHEVSGDIETETETQTYAYTPKSWSFGPNKANVFAIAASLLLVVGAVLFGIFGRPIDSRSTGISQAAEAAESVGQEHINVASNKTPLEEMNTKGCTSCNSILSACCIQIGTSKIPEINLTSVGYEFKGGMECEVPYCESSYHLFFRQINGRGYVSVHIVKDEGTLNLDDGVPYESKMPRKTYRFFMNKEYMHGKPSVVAFSDGEVKYMVMTCIVSDTERVIASIQTSVVGQDH